MTQRVVVDAPAKVNLRLKVLAREASDFHSLETVFCAVSFADTIEVAPDGNDLAVRVVGDVDVGPPEHNLVLRAARRFHEATGIPARAAITLHKRLPSAAGLGGGSSDAAATLRALNHAHGSPLPDAALAQLAIELGSDVPFFLCGSTLALAWGRGERLLPLPPLPARPVVIAHPGRPVATAGAFARLAAARGAVAEPTASVLPRGFHEGWAGVAAVAENDFEPVVLPGLSEMAEVKRAFEGAGALIALLAGSGGAVFGIFPDEASAANAAAQAERLGVSVWRASTLEAPPTVRVDPLPEGA